MSGASELRSSTAASAAATLPPTRPVGGRFDHRYSTWKPTERWKLAAPLKRLSIW
jgi:hypothetical protein